MGGISPHGAVDGAATRSRRSVRPRLVAGIGAAVAAALVVPAVVVYACVGLVGLTATPNSVQPGGTIKLNGLDFVPTAPVTIHLDTITGPVIATVTALTGGVMSSQFHQDVIIPSSVSPGQHLLIATQDQHNMNGGNPARAVIYVGSAAPGPTGPESRPASATIDNGPSLGVLAGVAAGALIVGLVIFGAIALRPPRTPQTGAA
ncbi:MAG: hypothetical protein ACREN2_02120 [Candidatus Dormibacteria bacterium]